MARRNDYANETARMIYDRLVGLGVPQRAAMGAVGSLMGESGAHLEPRSVNRGDGADGSDSIGIGQWNQGRATALKRTAASMGVPWQDPRAQVEHLVNELNGSHRHVLNALKRGPDTIEAGENTWTRRFEVAGKPHHERRIAHGYGFANALGQAPTPAQAPAPTAMAQAQPQKPTRAITAQPRQTGGFAPFSNPNALIPKMLAAFSNEPRAIPGEPQTTGSIIPASFTPEAPQMAPQAAPQTFQAPPAPQAPQGAPSIPNGFMPPSFADAAGITPQDPTPLGARTGMTQVGGEADVRRNPSFSDGFFGRAPQGMPMTLAPQGDRQYIETGFDPAPAPAENPLVVRGIRPKPEQPQPSFVPMPPPRPSNDQLFAQPQPMPQRAETGQPERPTGSTPSIWGANWHGPNSGLINHAQAPAGTPYPDVWTGPSPYPNEGNLFKILGLF